jgi:hypothetical protein
MLVDLADGFPYIAAYLEDTTKGRRAVVTQLDNWGYTVSEKLVRKYRDNRLNENNVIHMTDYVIEPLTTEKLETYKPLFSDGTEMKITQGSARGSRTIVIMPDVQAPLHDQSLVNKFVDFIYDFQPNEIAQVGDFTDSTEISRWVRGKRPEFAGDLRKGFLAGQDIIDDIREVFDGRFRIVRSNHDDRLELYIQNCAPGLASFGDYELSFESLMRFNDYDVEFIRDGMVELIKDEWIMGHGDEGSLSPQAGKTAFGLAKNKFGVNVVCGHTHRAGMTSESYGYNGEIRRTLTGLEVGHFMDIRQANYLDKKGGTANWQQAFGILETINGKTFPHLITVNDGNFSFESVMY